MFFKVSVYHMVNNLGDRNFAFRALKSVHSGKMFFSPQIMIYLV